MLGFFVACLTKKLLLLKHCEMSALPKICEEKELLVHWLHKQQLIYVTRSFTGASHKALTETMLKVN